MGWEFCLIFNYMYLSIFLTYLSFAFLFHYVFLSIYKFGGKHFIGCNFGWNILGFLLIFGVLLLDCSTHLFLNRENFDGYLFWFFIFSTIISSIISQLYFSFNGWVITVSPIEEVWLCSALKTVNILIGPIPFLIIGMHLANLRYLRSF